MSREQKYRALFSCLKNYTWRFFLAALGYFISWVNHSQFSRLLYIIFLCHLAIIFIMNLNWIATTPVAPCTPTNISSSSTLLSISSVNSTGYICYAYEWTALTTGNVTLAFQLRNDPSNWYLDDVSVYDGGIQILVNGGFESGSLSPWVVTFPNGFCQLASPSGQLCNALSHTGSYEYCDGCYGVADQVSQPFMATAGQVYVISFWLATGSTGSVMTALVTI